MKFLFLGNGSFNNHGCEAIVHGTMAILKAQFGPDVFAANGVSESAPVVVRQEQEWAIPRVQSFSVVEPPSIVRRIRARLARARSAEVRTSVGPISEHAQQAKAMLALGGDNFSLEYGVPYRFLGWNAVARDLGLPTVIWGSSIGPFKQHPAFENAFIRHARTLDAVFVRETETFAYLHGLGLKDNVHLASDPAFAMEPLAPRRDLHIPKGAIGVNLSPLMAQFVSAGDLDAWELLASDILEALAQHTGRPLVLVPHVNASEATRAADPGWHLKDDFGFMGRVAERCASKVQVSVLDDRLSAPELKYLISRLWAFAGARTHATIAAFGTGVPCISFAYSVKAQGLNKDILGTTEYCIPPADLSPARVVEAFTLLERNRAMLLERYADVLPGIKRSAFASGATLAAIMEARR